MDPNQAALDLFESFMMKQWFVAAVLIADIAFLIIAFAWVLRRQDKRDKENQEAQEKRDLENKEVIHNYYNATSTNALTIQALAKSMEGVGEEMADLRRAVDALRMKEALNK